MKAERWNKGIAWLALAGVVIALGILLYLPADFFDEGQSVCLSVLVLDRECHGCGMTRAIQHLIHGEFQVAYHYNKLSFIVLPLAAGLILNQIFRSLFSKTKLS